MIIPQDQISTCSFFILYHTRRFVEIRAKFILIETIASSRE